MSAVQSRDLTRRWLRGATGWGPAKLPRTLRHVADASSGEACGTHLRSAHVSPLSPLPFVPRQGRGYRPAPTSPSAARAPPDSGARRALRYLP